MNWRCLVVSCVVVGVVSLLPVSATAQNRPTSSGAPIGISGLLAPADGTTLPLTPWGDPDLQGVWNNSTRTPLERLTDAERERGRVA